MVKIKQLPEDFVVREIFEKQKEEREDNGKYVWFTLKKTNWDLFRAINTISRNLGVSVKRFGYAGVKDKRAVTYQKISVWNVPIERMKEMKIKDMEISDLEEKEERINLGDLSGNEFMIVVRDIDEKKVKVIEKKLAGIRKSGFINYFGLQRFGNRGNTHIVGKEIIRNDLKEAVWVYLTYGGDDNEEAKKFRKNLKETGDFKSGLKECPRSLRNETILLNHLVKTPNDYAGALRRIPKKFRRMFVHAYQSYLWNETAKASREEVIPVVGYETDIEKYRSKSALKRIMKKENISPSDFRIKSMPELSSPGAERPRMENAENLEWKFGKDEINEKKMKCDLSFILGKGAYATVLIDNVFA